MTEQLLNQEVCPTYPQALLGYRAWRMEDGHLCPLFINDQPWLPGINTAVCSHGDKAYGGAHKAPGKNCNCGFNAYDDYLTAFEQARIWIDWFIARRTPPWKLVIGAVAGAGNVEVHQQGFRCRQAQILGLADELYLRREVRGYADELAAVVEHYQVPLFDDDKYLEDHILSLPGVSPSPQQAKPQVSHATGKVSAYLRWLLRDR